MWKVEIRRANRPGDAISSSVDIGRSLAALRRDRDVTLKSAAAMCSVSAATLSRIENGSLSPSFDVISNICAGFQIGISEFLAYGNRTRLSGWRVLTRAGTGQVLETPHYRFEILGDEIVRKPFLVLRAEILKRSIQEFGDLQSHAGHEQVIVESGAVEIWTEHYSPVRLNVGDSLTFDSALGHAVISLGDQPAKVLWICDAPDFAA